MPGIAKSWCDHDYPARPSAGRANGAVLEGLLKVEADETYHEAPQVTLERMARLEEVMAEEVKELLEAMEE